MDRALPEGTFDEIKEELGRDAYWIGFFVRPCCPPPPAKTAAKNLEALRDMVRERDGLDDMQKAELIGIIDGREKWYRTSSLCRDH